MGDSSIEVTDENRDASQEAKAQAVEAISEGINISILHPLVIMHVVNGVTY